MPSLRMTTDEIARRVARANYGWGISFSRGYMDGKATALALEKPDRWLGKTRYMYGFRAGFCCYYKHGVDSLNALLRSMER